jgi:hypothetical protein
MLTVKVCSRFPKTAGLGTEHASTPPSSVPEGRHGDFAPPNRPVDYRSSRPGPGIRNPKNTLSNSTGVKPIPDIECLLESGLRAVDPVDCHKTIGHNCSRLVLLPWPRPAPLRHDGASQLARQRLFLFHLFTLSDVHVDAEILDDLSRCVPQRRGQCIDPRGLAFPGFEAVFGSPFAL